MWIRARFDIGWLDLAAGVIYCMLPQRRTVAVAEAEREWCAKDRALVTLSVRSAFDLTLRALQLPAGSEVLLTALTVPDMVKIVTEHGLKSIPVDTNENGMICLDSLRQSITNRTRMLVVAHLFGGSCQMDDVLEIAHQRDVLVIEDCAQSFTQVGGNGHPNSDVVMHSFGPIKTATATGGGVIEVACDELRDRMRGVLAKDPVQTRQAFGRRLLRMACLKLLSGRALSALLFRVLAWLRFDVDVTLTALGRGFPAGDLLEQIRVQPSTPLLRLMRRRWKTYDFNRISRRTQLGRLLDKRLGVERSQRHTYWVYPIFRSDANGICQRLQARGFDATCSSRMIVVPPDSPSAIPKTAADMWQNVIFLPWYPELTESAVEEMAAILR